VLLGRVGAIYIKNNDKMNKTHAIKDNSRMSLHKYIHQNSSLLIHFSLSSFLSFFLSS